MPAFCCVGCARPLARQIHCTTSSAFRHWLVAIAICGVGGYFAQLLIIWVLPVTIMLQLVTIGRILCEHRFPEPALIAARGREFVCRATAGVFPGIAPPAAAASSPTGLAAWTCWWLN